MKRIIILGGRGDGLVVASCIEDIITVTKEKISLLGFLNDSGEDKINEYRVLGPLKDASSFSNQEDLFFVSALLKVKRSYARSMLINSLNISLSKFITIIHPTATVAKSAKIGSGTVIGPHVTIMPNVKIGNHCSIRASANIGHDCILEDFCYMGPNSSLAGRSKMAIGAHLGANSSVLDSKVLGAYSVVGISSGVVRNVNSFDVVFGCPARKIGKAYK
ncbi:MAG: hypothetical protein DRH50_06330 [Deltaproteobacteria bacterium]|nr:MAG: hypothetical protein DRH50_06330 [Deltaproteobacteria bacterium]